MTRHDDRVRVRHALDAARMAVASTSSWRREDLGLSKLSTLGLIRLLEVVGEAAASVSADTKAAHPELTWRQMSGLRNRSIHGYFDVNLDIVWDTIQSDLPPIVTQLERVLEALPESRT